MCPCSSLFIFYPHNVVIPTQEGPHCYLKAIFKKQFSFLVSKFLSYTQDDILLQLKYIVKTLITCSNFICSQLNWCYCQMISIVLVLCSNYIISNIPAAPCPDPTHMVTIPNFFSLLFSSLKS